MPDAPALSSYGTNRTVNAVDDLGWDNTGTEQIPKPPGETGLEIEVPPGEYLVGSRFDYSRLTDWCLRGTGSHPEDVRFVAAEGYRGTLFNIRAGSFALGNFVLDQRRNWTSALGMNVLGKDWLIQSVYYAGWRPNENQGTTTALNAYVTDPAGTGYISDFYADERTSLVAYPKCAIQLFSGPEHTGTMHILDSTFENSGEHGVYASRCAGDVRIDGCTFRNNQNTQARISGEGSYVKNSLFIWDDTSQNEGTFQAQTGLTFESGYQGFAGGLVENTRFICEASAPNSGVVKVDGSHGGVAMRDLEIFVQSGVRAPAITVQKPGDSHMITGLPDEPWDIEMTDVSVIHEGSQLWTYDAAVATSGRTVTLRNVCLDARNGSVHGLRGDEGMLMFEGSNAIAASPTKTDIIGSASRTNMASISADPDCLMPIKQLPQPEPAPGEEPAAPSYAHFGLIRSGSETPATRYTVRTSGEIALVTEGPNKSETSATDTYAERVQQNEDGTWTMTGATARGGLDSFEFNGELLEWTADAPNAVTLTVDGESKGSAPVPEPDPAPEPAEVREPEPAPEPEPEPEPTTKPEPTPEPAPEPEPEQTLRERAEAEGYTYTEVTADVILLVRR